jgi:hypothetical protein
MGPDGQTVLHRFHSVLVQKLGARNPRDLSPSLTLADLYYDLVPFETFRDELGVGTVFEYERALLQLLAGEGGILEMEYIADRQKLQRHLDSPNPDSGAFHDFLASGVRIRPTTEELLPARSETKELQQFENCPSCREHLPQQVGGSFCPFCGSDLRRVHCVSCDGELRLDWRFCIACGTGVEPQRSPLSPH